MNNHNATSQLVLAARYRKDQGISDVTLWRRIKAGQFHPIRIANRLYLRRKEIEDFERRALAGEFDEGPSGIAAVVAKGGAA